MSAPVSPHLLVIVTGRCRGEGAMEEGVAAAANALREASYAVAFTGAGISTPSGIPDFRSPGTGLWHQVRPALVASTWTLRLRPRVFYAWMRPLAHRILEAEPNAAHRALVELEEAGRLKAVITQNIDGLHQTAGSRRVLELHGHTRTATCLGCGRTVDTAPMIETILMGDIPHCAWCDGVLRPDVVLLGEMLPADVFAAAQMECERCDLLLVVGSSLEVTPAAELPLVALRAGADLVIVNLQPTPLDARASVFIRHDVATILPAITEEVLGGL